MRCTIVLLSLAALLLASACGGGEPTTPPTGEIAFSSCRDGEEPCDLYVINSDGSGLTKLAQGSFPVWAPDGSRIALLSGTGTSRDILVIGADGSDQTNLTNNPFDDYNPSWSPDGKRIAFVSSRDAPWILTPVPGHEGVPYIPGDYSIQQIYVMNVDGSRQTRLTENKTGGVGDFAPTWSPDGTRIAFISSRQVYVMNADGSDQTRLTTVSEGSLLYDVAWSPDGRRLAFNSSGGIDHKRRRLRRHQAHRRLGRSLVTRWQSPGLPLRAKLLYRRRRTLGDRRCERRRLRPSPTHKCLMRPARG
jgi:dipeptidyl aminopeptidase/acylaminoacyl peptidase